MSMLLEKRLASVEIAVAELQRQLQSLQPTNWLEQITGSFEDEPAFEEVLAYGRAIRQEDEVPLAREGINEVVIIWMRDDTLFAMLQIPSVPAKVARDMKLENTVKLRRDNIDWVLQKKDVLLYF